MRRHVGVALALGALLACSLEYRSSDYFDPTGQLVTIAIVPGEGEARLLGLSTENVVFATSSGLYAAPKSGGDPTLLRATKATDVSALAGDGADVVAWCGAMGVERWQRGVGIVTVDAKAPPCTSIDVVSGRVAVVLGTGNDAYELRTYRAPTFALEATTLLPVPKSNDPRAYVENHRVAVSGDALYFLSWAGYFRSVRNDDPPFPKSVNECQLGALDILTTEHFAIGRAPSGERWAFLQTGNGVFAYGGDSCCNVLGGICDGPRAVAGTGGARTIVVRDRYLYTLTDAELARSDLATLTVGSDAKNGLVVVRGGLDGVTGSLAVDGTHAFFGQGHRIQRVALLP